MPEPERGEVALHEHFRESAPSKKRGEGVPGGLWCFIPGRQERSNGRLRVRHGRIDLGGRYFPHGEGMQTILPVSPQEAVAAFLAALGSPRSLNSAGC